MSAKVLLALCLYFFNCYGWESLPEYCGKDSYSYTPLRKGPKGQEYTLKQVHVVIRHGDRTQAGMTPCWPNDTAEWDCLLTSASLPVVKHDTHDITVDRVYRDVYMPGRNDIKGDCGLGHLTFKGYKQQELNGQNLRKAYVETGFLSSNYSNHEVFFRTDVSVFSLQSAQALALGLFPPSLPTAGKSQVVDINVMDKDYDDIEPNPRLCPKLDQYEREFFASDMWKKHYNEKTIPLLNEVQKALGLGFNLTSEGLIHIADCLLTHTCHSFPIPPGITEDLFTRIGAEIEFMWYASYSYPTIQEYSKVGIGFLIGEIWEAMQEALEESKARKFFLYSGHDHTVMPLLQAFNASDYKWSPYASMVQLELLEMNNGSTTDYAVRLLYHGQEQTIPYCRSSPCPLAQFSDYIRQIVSSDPATDCKVTNPEIMHGPRPPHPRRARILF
ncbi:counting factor 60-like isoform X2 [Oculina patagonica]